MMLLANDLCNGLPVYLQCSKPLCSSLNFQGMENSFESCTKHKKVFFLKEQYEQQEKAFFPF